MINHKSLKHTSSEIMISSIKSDLRVERERKRESGEGKITALTHKLFVNVAHPQQPIGRLCGMQRVVILAA